MITLITLDTLRNVSFLADSTYLRVQFWCCLFFIADVFIEMSFAQSDGCISEIMPCFCSYLFLI
ncbi:hypothetical protein [Duncaniella dubosii]|uniref:hypothetical protein n=1 Tax=Duncaniella dubosii TaxID=2518971 RepID=UPI003F680053